MRFDDDGERLLLRDGERVIAEYVYRPAEPQIESPRPYLLLRTRDGVEVTGYRPDDHPWHKGLSLALPAVGAHNFWGGPTYVRDRGYVQLPNNGAQMHRDFVAQDATSTEERLDWISQDGDLILSEERRLTARVVDAGTWALTWQSALRNVTDAPLAFGSPTTKGRADAGYAGIFWRGPTSFTGGVIRTATGAAGDAARGMAGPWLAFVAPDRAAGVLMMDAAPGGPWFARSEEYAGLNPAPFFFEETIVAPDATLVLAAAVLIGAADVDRHAATVGAELAEELRADPRRARREDDR